MKLSERIEQWRIAADELHVAGRPDIAGYLRIACCELERQDREIQQLSRDRFTAQHNCDQSSDAAMVLRCALYLACLDHESVKCLRDAKTRATDLAEAFLRNAHGQLKKQGYEFKSSGEGR